MTQPSVYLDANVVIRLLEYEDASVRAFLRQLHRVGGVVATSELTLAEALVVPVAKDDRDLIAIYENFLSTGEGVVMIPVDRAVLRRTAAIRAEFRSVRTPDAIHVASALERGCGSFLTGDRRLRGPADLEFINLLDLPGQEEANQ